MAKEKVCFFAEGGIPGSVSMAVWVGLMMVPSGNVTDKGCNAFSLLIHSASNARKFPVAPEFKMADLHKLLGGVESR
jgi:hypothetical protein